jgi:hypothetical protein
MEARAGVLPHRLGNSLELPNELKQELLRLDDGALLLFG